MLWDFSSQIRKVFSESANGKLVQKSQKKELPPAPKFIYVSK